MNKYKFDASILDVDLTIEGNAFGATRSHPPTDTEVTDILVRGQSILPVVADHVLDVAETLFMEHAIDMWRGDLQDYCDAVREDARLDLIY